MYYRQFKVSLASFRSLVRSLWTAKHQSLATSKISETLGFCGETRMELCRLGDVQSTMNCVNREGEGFAGISAEC